MTAGNYSKTILDNGIRIVSEKMEGVRSVSVGVWILIGSRNESRRNCGISHLLEHMLFKGTESRTAFEIAVSLESLGGTLNAFTDREFTCIYAVVLDDNVSEAVEVMADVILNPVLDEKDLRVEKQVVLEEIRNLEDSPEDRIHEVFVQTVFNNRSLGSSTLGTYESIRRMKKSDLSAYHNKFCAANNIIIAAAGCIDHDFFVDCVSKYFHALNRGADSVYEQFVLGQDFNRSLRSSISQSHICTGMPSFSYDSPEKISLIVLNSILGGGMSSRLFQEIREKKGLAYTIYSFFDFWSDTGLMGVYTGTSKKNAKKVIQHIESELRSLCERPISKEELERTKSQLKRSLLLSMEDSGSRMNRLAKSEAYTQRYATLDEVVSRIESVSEEQVQNLSHELFHRRQRYTVILETQ